MLSHTTTQSHAGKKRILRALIALSTVAAIASPPALMAANPVNAVPTARSTPNQALPQQHWLPAIQAAIENLDASRLPSVPEARAKLDVAVQNLEALLDRSPAKHREDWLKFLNWESVKAEIAKENADPDFLLQTEKTFRQNYDGMELGPFVNLREALGSYANALMFGKDHDRTLKILSNRLTLLSNQIQSEDLTQSDDANRDLRQTVEILNAANQSADLTRIIERSFARPNARVLLSSHFLQSNLGRPVQEHNPVCEDILGTRIVGNSLLVGSVRPTLIHNPKQATLRLTLDGDFSSQNVGHNRGVLLHTQGSAKVFASETVTLNNHGLQAMGDTGVDAMLSTHIDSIDAKLRLIEKIAAKTAAKQKPQADAIAESRMENRIRNQFHNQLTQQLAETNSRIDGPTPVELTRLGLQKPTRSSWSSLDFLSLLWKVNDGTQLSAPSSCPLIVPTTGMVVQIHESAVANTLNPILEGRTLRSEDAGLYRKQFGELAGTALRQDESEPWSITLATYQPVESKFEDGLITLRIRTTRLDRGDRELDQNADIQASYLPQIIDGKLQLVRQGDVHIRFYGKQATGMRASTLRTFLKRKFDEVFKEQLLDKPLDITERLPDQFKNLSLQSVDSDQGWLQAHLD